MDEHNEEDTQEEVLLNPATHENMDDGFDMDFGLGNTKDSGDGFDMGLEMNLGNSQSSNNGFDMGLDLGLDF